MTFLSDLSVIRGLMTSTGNSRRCFPSLSLIKHISYDNKVQTDVGVGNWIFQIELRCTCIVVPVDILLLTAYTENISSGTNDDTKYLFR